MTINARYLTGNTSFVLILKILPCSMMSDIYLSSCEGLRVVQYARMKARFFIEFCGEYGKGFRMILSIL